MSDLIQRLRAHYPYAGLPREAADRIEALEAALRAIAEVCRVTTPNKTVLTTIRDCARASLAPETSEPKEPGSPFTASEKASLYANQQAGNGFTKEILEADRQPPEATFDNADDMMAYLNQQTARD